MRRSLYFIVVRMLPCLPCLVALVALTGCGTISRASGPVSSDVAGLFVDDGAGSRNASTGPGSAPSAPGARPEPPTSVNDTAESVDWLGAASTDVVMAPTPLEPPATVAARDADSPSLRSENENAPALLVAQDKDKKDKAKDEYDEYDVEDYDPWERFNETMFNFNLKLDRYVLKPIAKVYDKILPDRIQIMISNVIDNAAFVPRMMNSIFQGKWDGAVRELGRFMLNSTVGVGGFFDIAKHEGIEKSREDFGQTLGYYGADPGPYVQMPFLEPLTVRDGLGKLVDMFLDPVGYFVAFFPVRFSVKVVDIVNDRSLNLELYQGFEETTIDLYSAVRHAYLQRRQQLIKE